MWSSCVTGMPAVLENPWDHSVCWYISKVMDKMWDITNDFCVEIVWKFSTTVTLITTFKVLYL